MNKNRNISLLSDKEMNNVKGGGYWDPEMGWVLDTVTVYGEKPRDWGWVESWIEISNGMSSDNWYDDY